jgi:hypothetical protein
LWRTTYNLFSRRTRRQSRNRGGEEHPRGDFIQATIRILRMSCEHRCGQCIGQSCTACLRNQLKTDPQELCHYPNFPHCSMSNELMSASEAARRLGIRPATLYDWLGKSRYGLLEIRGQLVVIAYFQGGPKGQGRIQIPSSEVERLRELMRVPQMLSVPRRPPVPMSSFPGITVPLGRPNM